MKITVEDRGHGRHDILFGKTGRNIPNSASLTGHDLDDLLAVLEQRKAMGRYCNAEDGEHTCVMPPGHSILAHLCRACPREWPAR